MTVAPLACCAEEDGPDLVFAPSDSNNNSTEE
jgi:hypothetical protein